MGGGKDIKSTLFSWKDSLTGHGDNNNNNNNISAAGVDDLMSKAKETATQVQEKVVPQKSESTKAKETLFSWKDSLTGHGDNNITAAGGDVVAKAKETATQVKGTIAGPARVQPGDWNEDLAYDWMRIA